MLTDYDLPKCHSGDFFEFAAGRARHASCRLDTGVLKTRAIALANWIASRRHCRWYRTAFVPVLIALLPFSPLLAAPDTDGRYRVAIMLTSQQGRIDLSQTLLALTPREDRPWLKMSPDMVGVSVKALEDRYPKSRYHLNPQQYTLDLATELKVWPDGKGEGEVAILPTPDFLQRFGSRITTKRDTAFPDVSVTSLPFALKLPREAALTTDQAQRAKDGQQVQGQTRELLCNPLHTLIDRSRCQVVVRVPTFGGEPVIAVLQMGFRVETRQAMPEAAANQLIEEIRLAIRTARKADIPAPDFAATLIPERGWKGSPQQKPQDLALQGQQATALQGTASVVASEIDGVWGRAFVTVPILAQSTDLSRWPLMNIFDSAAPKNLSIRYQDWLSRLNGATLEPSGPDCELKPTAQSHTDAVASLLFPSLIKRLLDPNASGPQSPVGFPGLIQGQSYLVDPQPQSLTDFALARPPEVALAVYSDISRGKGMDSDAARLAKSLTSSTSKKILIVSAPSKASVTSGLALQFSRTPSYQQDPKLDAILNGCKIAPFPSCLGQLPRVLVVSPDMGRFDYVVGSSTVGIAAPGNTIPVVHSCKEGDSNSIRWGKVRADGSSYAVPIVAAIIGKILSISEPGLPASQDPLIAMMRVLATAEPLPDNDSSDPNDVAYGSLRADRALMGASAKDEGSDKYATVYLRNKAPEFQIISPYPWANDYLITGDPNRIPRDARLLGVWQNKRGAIRVTTDDAEGAEMPLDFRRVLRILRRDTDKSGHPRFDVYFLEKDRNAASARVKVISNARIGRPDADPMAAGYCSENGAGTYFAACLYSWDGTSSSGFQPLDLSTVQDIVLSPNHFMADFVNGFDPIDFALALKPDDAGRQLSSSWREAFCKTGISPAVLAIIVQAKYPSDTTNILADRRNGLLAAYRQYCGR
jgi:hypothetical protein